MTKSATMIKVDFKRAIQKANDLDKLAERLKYLAGTQMEENFQTLNYFWTGEVANEFLQKGRSLENKMSITAKQMTDVAEVIRSAARTTYNAEMEAYKIAHIHG